MARVETTPTTEPVSPTIARRAVLGGAAAAAVAVSRPARAVSSRAELDALYAERTALAARSRELQRQWEAMRALVVRLPDHAGAEREAGLSVVADQQHKVEERLGEIDDRIETLRWASPTCRRRSRCCS
ncbi:broad specificity polyphosphatase/5'/3'-nucleotidase SurE [Bradyrhizobium sp. USDA 4506]